VCDLLPKDPTSLSTIDYLWMNATVFKKHAPRSKHFLSDLYLSDVIGHAYKQDCVPRSLVPERWLRLGHKELRAYPVALDIGFRRRIASNLAHPEVFLTLAAIVRTFNMELSETDAKDVEFIHDPIDLHPQPGTQVVGAAVEDKAVRR